MLVTLPPLYIDGAWIVAFDRSITSCTTKLLDVVLTRTPSTSHESNRRLRSPGPKILKLRSLPCREAPVQSGCGPLRASFDQRTGVFCVKENASETWNSPSRALVWPVSIASLLDDVALGFLLYGGQRRHHRCDLLRCLEEILREYYVPLLATDVEIGLT